jgi:hypothetical protein
MPPKTGCRSTLKNKPPGRRIPGQPPSDSFLALVKIRYCEGKISRRYRVGGPAVPDAGGHQLLTNPK